MMRKPHRKNLARIVAAAAVVGLLAGCAVGPDFHPPQGPTSQTYGAGPQLSATVSTEGPGGSSQRFAPEMDIPAQWWSLFQSESLDRLVRQALADSPTLAQARAKLKQAQEEFTAKAAATRYPALDADISVTGQQVNLAAMGLTLIPNPDPFSLFNASVSVSYTLDVFGGNRRTLEGLKARIDYEAFELEAARQTLAANVVNAAIRQASLRLQVAILQDLLAAQGHQLAITEERCRAGGVAELDLHNQRLLLNQTRAKLPPLEKQLLQVNHQLAIYLGREPAEARIDALDLNGLSLPETLPLSLPSSLARQRPDIRAAEALWHQASANVGVATANLFPQFTISGNFAAQATDAGELLSGINAWSFAGNLMQPVFHGGELRARKRAAVAAYDDAAAAYRQTVLRGLQEVADTLAALETDARTLETMAGAAHHARAGYDIAQGQYTVGGISHLALLDAERQMLQAENDRVQAQAARYTDTAALLLALGGGWWHAEVQNEPRSTDSMPVADGQ